MRVLIDAQLPQRLSRFLSSHNIDSKHTLDLPKQNATPDEEINQLVARENRIVVSKDSDFLESFILEGRPKEMLLVSTGNINNAELISLFKQNINTLKYCLRKIIWWKSKTKKYRSIIRAPQAHIYKNLW